MRPRLFKPVYCTVRPNVPTGGDIFGDRSVMAKDERGNAILMVPIQLTYIRRSRSQEATPGRDSTIAVVANVLERTSNGWTPAEFDIVEVPGQDKLFVMDVQPAYPILASRRRPTGGFAGWRLELADQKPTLAAATEYDH